MVDIYASLNGLEGKLRKQSGLSRLKSSEKSSPAMVLAALNERDPERIMSMVEHNLAVLLDAGISGLHFDVSDGTYASRSMFTPGYASSIVKYAVGRRDRVDFPVDAHLVVREPVLAVDSYLDAGATSITLPYQYFSDRPSVMHAAIDMIKDARKVPVGVSLSPHEALNGLRPNSLRSADYVVVICSGPGIDAPPVMPKSDAAVSRLAKIRDDNDLGYRIIAEGGINERNAASLKKAGADVLVLGLALFESKFYAGFIEKVQNA
jgi:ribulose-phosphate 3-epimerase